MVMSMIRFLKNLVRTRMMLSRWLVFLISTLVLVACSSAKASNQLVLAPTRTPVTLPSATKLPPSPLPLTPTVPPDTATPSPVPPTSTPTLTQTVGPPSGWLIPDSEIVYSPSTIDFDVLEYVFNAGGFLNNYRQYLMITDWTTGADIVTRVALENSINPRLLLALLEFQSGCVLGEVDNPDDFNTAMGATQANRLDLYGQLVWAVHVLSEGYYGWRDGTLTEFSLIDGTIIRPHPDLNAGTVAIKYLFSNLFDRKNYELALDPTQGFPALFVEMFGNPWERAIEVEPLILPDVEQPTLTLPFGPGKAWAFTGGPHPAFETNGPLASLDFAPPTTVTGCYQSDDWVLAMADGLVVRSEIGVVIQDLDGDGSEQTGWVLMYLHIEERHRVPTGTYLHEGDQVGHPSCEGGRATGTHVHIARKYNGEWIPASGSIPFVLDGWVAHAGDSPYLGTLTRGDEVVTAHQFGSYISRISRDD